MTTKAITTKYLGPTDFKGTRIKATDYDGNSITISLDQSVTTEKTHATAARMLCDRLKTTRDHGVSI